MKTFLRNKVENSTLQELIDHLQQTAHSFLSAIDTGCVYPDEISDINHDIHSQINELYDRRKEAMTVNQEAALCLTLLMGYSVSMYANPEDEEKRKSVLDYSHRVITSLPSSSLKFQLQNLLLEME